MRIACEGEERNIVKLVEAVRSAKKPIEVDYIRIEYSEPTDRFKNFRIIIGDQLREMSERFGTGSTYISRMLGKHDVVINEIRSISSNMHDMMDARFQQLEDEISKIKARLP